MADLVRLPRPKSRAVLGILRGGYLTLPLLASLPVLAVVLHGLPVLPHLTFDSLGYLRFGEDRPPGYPWLLAAWKTLVGPDLRYLPVLQTLLIAAGVYAFAVELGRRLRSALAGALAVPLLWAHTGVYEASRWVMSEGLFLPALLGGLAATLALARSRSRTPLVIAALCFAAAILARTSAYLLAATPLLALAFDSGLPTRLVLRRGLLYVLVLAVPLLQGMADHAARYGSFGLGSRGGFSLLGKGLLLLRPASADDPLTRSLLPEAAAARAAVAAAPDFGASLRAQAQAYELLRWPAFFDAATQDPDWPRDMRGQNAAAGRLALRAIRADPLGYLRLVARDWASALLMPQMWASGAPDSTHPFFAPCADGRAYCWTLHALGTRLPYRVAMIATAIAGTLGSFLLVLLAPAILRRRVPDGRRSLLSLALTAQATLLATVLFEAGLWRYELAAHPANVAITLWLALVSLRAWQARRRRPWGFGVGVSNPAPPVRS